MKSNSIKVFISLMFFTGLLQIDILNIQWQYLQTIMAVHILGSSIIAVLLIIPFANTHSYYMFTTKKKSNIDGFILGAILFFIIASGFYLFLIGNTGGDSLGIISFYIHLIGGFLLVVSLFYHINNVKNNIAILILFIYPIDAYSVQDKLISIKYDDNVTRYHNEDWTNSTKCKSCHTDIFNQWANSNHKNLTSSNPYYMVQEALAAKDMGEDFRQWCMQCHNPSAVTTKQRASSHAMNGNILEAEMFDINASLLKNTYKEHGNFILEEGVSCVACHRMTKVDEKGNASYSLDLTNRKKYAFEDNDAQITQWLSQKFINAKPEIHKKSYSKDIYKDSKMCASCHNESLPNHRNINKNVVGKKIVSTYDEWEKSPFNNPNDITKHKSCIDCHMTYMENGKFSPLKGVSTTRGIVKKDIKVHYFAGSNHFLSGLKSKEHENQTIQLLKTSAKLNVNYKNNKLYIIVKNVGAGHHLPTGVADFRELWLDVEIKDSNNVLIFTSGKLNNNGDVKDEARMFKKVFGDKDNKPVGLLFWRYENLISDTRIPAGKQRVERYSIDQINISYPIKVTVKLNFRIYPQWITNAVRKAYPTLPNPPIIELNKIEKTYSQ